MKIVLLFTLFILQACSDSSESSSLVVNGSDSTTTNVETAKDPATISNIIPPSNGLYIKGNTLSFSLVFSEKINVVGTPRIIILINGSTYYVNYNSGSNTTDIEFSLLLPNGVLDLDGIGFLTLDLNGGTLKDTAGINADLNISSPDLSNINIDTQIPTVDSFQINAGASYTTSTSGTLSLTATDANEMYITTDSSCNSLGSWESFNSSSAYTLSSNANNLIYVKVRDVNLNESTCVDTSIIHDNQAPNPPASITLANDASDIATDNSSWGVASDIGPSGIKTYEYAVSTTPDDTNIITGGTWSDTASALTFQFDSGVSLVGGTNYYTLVRTIDNAGNTSTYTVSSSWTIIVSPEAITNLEASNKTVDTIDLGWSYPIDNGTAITDYEIQVKGGTYSDWTLLSDGVSTQTSTSVTGLDPETTYEFKVRAFNGINYSGWSNTLSANTLPNLDFFTGGFKAINISGAPKSKVVSFDDANEIYIDGALETTLQKGETYEFDSTDFTVIEGSKALYVAGKLGTGSGSSDQGNATWATSSWVGNEFFFNLTRMAPLKVKVYAFTDSEITIKTGSSTVDTQTLSAESGHVFTLTNYANYQMNSTGLIVAFIYGNASGLIYDPQPLLPVTTDLIGFPSKTAKVTSGTDSNNYDFFHTNGVSTNGTLNASSTLSVNPQGTSSLYQSQALRIITAAPISANSNADSNGYCQAPFVPTSMLKKRYGLNTASNWIALASDRPVTVTLSLPDTSTVDVVLTRTGSGKSPYKAYIAADYPEGTILEGTDKFQAWYQPYTTTYSGGEDETIMFGWDE